MRSQGFFHPATLVPSELEYAEGYRARMNVVWSKMRPITPNNHQKTTKPKPQKAKSVKSKQKLNQPETKSAKKQTKSAPK